MRKLNREGFIVYLNINNELSGLTASEILSDLSNSGFNAVVPQKILEKLD